MNPAVDKALNAPLIGAVGLEIAPVSVDVTKSAPAASDAPDAQPAVKRPYLNGAVWRGSWGGFGRVPALTMFYRWAIRRYPMAVKVHARVTKPVLSGRRSVEIVDDGGDPKLAQEIRDAANADLIPALGRALPGAMESLFFGHWLQEIVWDECSGRLVPVEVLPIMPTEGVVQIDAYRRFAGYQVAGEYRDARYGFLAVHNPHIDPVLGYAFSEAALASWFRANRSAENADGIERKASGIQMLFSMMAGVELEDDNGKPITIETKLTEIMNAAAQGSSVLVPSMPFGRTAIESNPELAKIPLLNMQPVDWGNTGPALEAHLARKRELDVEICAAMGVPERAVMEAANHGGYSDAVPAGDVVLDISEQLHGNLCLQWDDQVTARWQTGNFGKTKVKVRTVPSPLADPQQRFLQSLVTTLSQSTTADPEIAAYVDKPKLLERTGVPMIDATAAKQKLLEYQQNQQAQNQQAQNQQDPGGGRLPSQRIAVPSARKGRTKK